MMRSLKRWTKCKGLAQEFRNHPRVCDTVLFVLVINCLSLQKGLQGAWRQGDL